MNVANEDTSLLKAEAPRPTLATTIGRLTARLSGERNDPGELAALRRLVTGEKNAVFWRVLTNEVPDEFASGRIEEDLWAALLASFALLAPLGNGRGETIGGALATTGYSEPRLLRLLRADRERIADEVTAAARWLSAHGRSCDWLELARFVFSRIQSTEGSDHRTARKIARDYFTAISRKEVAQ
ncbi:MAG: type I-E CRISPR-associated protein Cse2/CasB [Parvibaculum sp.]|uniref:type I-E CRISPR-associated protein Cse2/CasB n=1 Tax=Parvibaculum sp. TaxID=2024848 RepID=UPI003C71E72F